MIAIHQFFYGKLRFSHEFTFITTDKKYISVTDDDTANDSIVRSVWKRQMTKERLVASEKDCLEVL
jgi:hypothetical protein